MGKNGELYEGDFKNGVAEGNGKETFRNGDYREGEYKEGNLYNGVDYNKKSNKKTYYENGKTLNKIEALFKKKKK